MKKICFVFGTRPEAIKLAPLINLVKRHHRFKTYILLTGQHSDLLQQVIDYFDINVDENLKVLKKGQNLSELTSKILLGVNQSLNKNKPDMVIVHGDTTSTLASSLASFYNNIPIGHVEAGLRSHNLLEPFPEEFNRRASTLAATLHFAPTESNKLALLNEGVSPSKIFVTGNTVIDALRYTLKKTSTHSYQPAWLPQDKTTKKKWILFTCHRRENIGNRFQGILEALKYLAETHPEFCFLYPLHPNPTINRRAKSVLSTAQNIHLLDAMSYPDFCWTMQMCYAILSDSGGIQEEAPYLNKPVLVLREQSERSEAIEAECVKLIGTEKQNIIDQFNIFISDQTHYKKMSLALNPYGDGYSAQRILNILEDHFYA